VKTNLRLEHILSLVDKKGFLSVSELSQLCGVSEMTIRRDLDQLDGQKRIHRTYGGAASYRAEPGSDIEKTAIGFTPEVEVLQVDQVDVLIATSVNPYYDGLLIVPAR
jgi:DeoR family L-fucose operon activator